MGSEEMEESLSVLLKLKWFIIKLGSSKYQEVSLECPTGFIRLVKDLPKGSFGFAAQFVSLAP